MNTLTKLLLSGLISLGVITGVYAHNVQSISLEEAKKIALENIDGHIQDAQEDGDDYEITIQKDQTIYDITKVFGSDNVYYEILNYKEKDVIKFNSEVIFYVKFKTSTPSTDVVNYKLNFNYKKVYYVSYDESLGSSKPETQIKYEGVNLTLTDKELTNPGYSFEGWSDEKNSNVVKYYPGDIYNKDENIILYPVWGIESYKLRVNPNGSLCMEDNPEVLQEIIPLFNRLVKESYER